jgi:hypothetical protein
MRLALAMALLAAATAHAGDRQLEVLFVNLTPDAQSNDASRLCVRAIESKIKADYSIVNKMGETALRQLTGKTAGEPFLEWPVESFKPARERKDQTWIDAVILVDCRPDAGQLDVLVNPASGGTARLAVRRVALDAKSAGFVGEAILRRAWAGFSP